MSEENDYLKKWRKDLVVAAHGGESYGWEKQEPISDIEVFSAKRDNGHIWSKGVGVVGATVEDIATFLRTAENKYRDDMFVRGHLVETIDDDTRVYYSTFKVPFPFWPRDICYLENSGVWGDNIAVSLARSVERREKCPPVASHVRAYVEIAGYVLEPIEEGAKTRVTYVLQVDPNGLMPAWAVRLIAKQQAQNVLRVRNHFDPAVAEAPVSRSAPQKFAILHDDVKKVKVAPGAQFCVDVEVGPDRCVLAWEFCTQSNDIGFHLRFTPQDATTVGVGTIAVTEEGRRFNAHEEIVQGSELTHSAGTFQLVFDNSYSKVTPKELTFRTSCTPVTHMFIERSESLQALDRARASSVSTATRLEEAERTRRVTEEEKAGLQSELMRERSAHDADKASEGERQRRIAEEEKAHVEGDVMRKFAQKQADRAWEAEKTTQVAEGAKAAAETQLLRRLSVSKADQAMDDEQRRLVAEEHMAEAKTEVVRRVSISKAVAAEEAEKARRVAQAELEATEGTAL